VRGGAEEITTEVLQTSAIVGGNPDVGVEVEAVELGLPRAAAGGDVTEVRLGQPHRHQQQELRGLGRGLQRPDPRDRHPAQSHRTLILSLYLVISVSVIVAVPPKESGGVFATSAFATTAIHKVVAAGRLGRDPRDLHASATVPACIQVIRILP
jgi:hypothetical protein